MGQHFSKNELEEIQKNMNGDVIRNLLLIFFGIIIVYNII